LFDAFQDPFHNSLFDECAIFLLYFFVLKKFNKELVDAAELIELNELKENILIHS
jgi:hypothetical protein